MQDWAKHKIYSAVKNIISTFLLLLWPRKGEIYYLRESFLVSLLTHKWTFPSSVTLTGMSPGRVAKQINQSKSCPLPFFCFALFLSCNLKPPGQLCIPQSPQEFLTLSSTLWQMKVVRNVWAVPGGKAEPHFQLCRCLLSQSELLQLFSSLLLCCTTYSSNCLPGMQQLMKLEDRMGRRS